MSTERYPKDLVITLEDFRKSAWLEAIRNAGEHGYPSYWDSFSKYARQAIECGNISSSKVLWLIADACSMVLKSESQNAVFSPISIINRNRSAITEDFDATDLLFFEEILSAINDYRLKARIADILWLVKKPKNVNFALDAIDAYQQFPLEDHDLTRDSKEAWHRAIILTRLLGKGAGDRIEKIRNSIYNKFHETNLTGKFQPLWLSELLEISGLEENESKTIAPKLEIFAQESQKKQDWHCARMYYDGAVRWNKITKDLIKALKCQTEIAETFVSEAESKISSENQSHMLAGHFFECAIHEYRKIPNKDRGTYRINERIDEVHKKMTNANELALSEMKPLGTPGIDISQMVDASQKHVAGREFQQSLLAFACIAQVPDFEHILLRAIENSKKFIFRQLFGSTHMARDGRVTARSPGINIDNNENPETKTALWEDMSQHYRLHFSLTAQANILPALNIINAEHRITEGFLLSLCHHSKFIPPGREGFWAKGLFYGFENDFVISTHLLIPQLEHTVRYQMKIKGLKTTNLDYDGIENENGLSTLLEHTEIEKVLSKNLLFEFKALLTDPIGPNLRNEFAHGLLEEAGAMSLESVYLWWLCVRLVIGSIPLERPKEI